MKTPTTHFLLLLLVLLGLLVTGCDSFGDSLEENEEGDPVVNGDYSDESIMLGSDIEAALELSLQEDDDGDVSGSGVIANPGATINLDVSGTHDYPDIALVFSSSGAGDFTLNGNVSDDGDLISGELEGSALDGVNVSLTRN